MKFLYRLGVFLGAASCFAQSPTPLYVESFRQGSTQIVEQNFDVKLTPHDPSYRERIKDSHGSDRYSFSIDPYGPEGDTSITSWQVKLADLQHRTYENLLLASQTPASDPARDQKNLLPRLDPSPFGPVPLAAKRIIKVDAFYVVLQVKAHHFTPPDSPYLDSMTVAIEFTNTDPRTAEGNPIK